MSADRPDPVVLIEPEASLDPAPRAEWLSASEKGSLLGMRLLVAVCLLAGRRVARAVLVPVVLWYVLLDRRLRRASRGYWRRLGVRTSFGLVYRHALRFAQVALDRVFLLRGRSDLFRIAHVGREHLARLKEQKRGALLVGAHLGSFEAMHVQSLENGFRVSALGFTGNARMSNAILRALVREGDEPPHVIELAPGAVSPLLEAQERIARGELVAVLADRVGLGERTALVDFLGAPMPLPLGPWFLAAALRCPVYLVFGLHTAPDRYELVCEPFAPDGLDVLRRGREEALRAVAARYAARVEHHLRRAPDNWFNFYDSWAVAR